MTQRHIDPENIHLTVNDVVFADKEIIIEWSSDIGWGQYTLSKDERKVYADSECMDKGDDKRFLREVLKKTSEYLEENAEIIG